MSTFYQIFNMIKGDKLGMEEDRRKFQIKEQEVDIGPATFCLILTEFLPLDDNKLDDKYLHSEY